MTLLRNIILCIILLNISGCAVIFMLSSGCSNKDEKPPQMVVYRF